MAKNRLTPQEEQYYEEQYEQHETELSEEEKDAYSEMLSNTAFRPQNYVTSQEHAKILIDNVLAQKHWYDGTKFMLEEIKQTGVEISLEPEDIAEMFRISEHLFKIRYYRQLIHTAGLGNFEDSIMQHIIDKFFQPKVATPAQRPAPLKASSNPGAGKNLYGER